jgi:hypothetical protein
MRTGINYWLPGHRPERLRQELAPVVDVVQGLPVDVAPVAQPQLRQRMTLPVMALLRPMVPLQLLRPDVAPEVADVVGVAAMRRQPRPKLPRVH